MRDPCIFLMPPFGPQPGDSAKNQGGLQSIALMRWINADWISVIVEDANQRCAVSYAVPLV